MAIQLQFKHQYADFNLDLSLHLPVSGITVILGASGSGKTTLLRLIAGLENACAGLVKIGDEVWQNAYKFLPAHERAAGFVFQDARLFPHLSVMQNIQYAAKRSKSRQTLIDINDALHLLQIHHLLARKPVHLSGGEKQRVAIARALAAQPAILLMDEPLASLDNALKTEIMPYILRLHELSDIPIIYVTHALTEAEKLADYVVEIENGKVLQAGVASEILPLVALKQHWQESMRLNTNEAQLIQHFRNKTLDEQTSILASMKS